MRDRVEGRQERGGKGVGRMLMLPMVAAAVFSPLWLVVDGLPLAGTGVLEEAGGQRITPRPDAFMCVLCGLEQPIS